MEHINGAKIRLERLTDPELDNLKNHVLTRLDEVVEDLFLVNREFSSRSGQLELEELGNPIKDSVEREDHQPAQ